MNVKLRLLKNIFIEFFDILLGCINFAYTYCILFLNKKQLLFKSINISIIYAIVFFLSNGLYNYLLFFTIIKLNQFESTLDKLNL